MNTAPRLTRSFPFWLLVVGSLASIGYGIWLTIDKLTTMADTLADGTATGVEVYVGQSWTVFGVAFVGAGLVGLVAALALVVARSLVARPVEVVETIAWDAEDEHVDDVPADDERVEEEPVETDPAPAEPASEEPVFEAPKR